MTEVKAFLSPELPSGQAGGSRPRTEQGTQKGLTAAGYPSQKRMILHIDDDEGDRMILEVANRELDDQFRIRQAENGIDALTILE
jgi:hypothetical protein